MCTVPTALLAFALLIGATGCSDNSASTTRATTQSQTATTTPTSVTSSPGSASTGTSSPTTTEASPTTAGSSTGAEVPPPFPTTPRPVDGGYGSGNGLSLTGVRTAYQDGFDRVVFDLGGEGTAGWYVRYVAHPRYDGSGDPIDVRGTVFLQVVLRGLGVPDAVDVPHFGDDSTRVPGTGTVGVSEIAPGGGPFEGDQLAIIGLTGAKRPFRAFSLADPTRIVVDVRVG